MKARGRNRRDRRERGIVLLVVLSLLVLFVVAGLTFALLAGYYRRSAIEMAKYQQKGDPPQKLLDQAMYVALRDTPEVNDPRRGHSLLRDMYGEPMPQGFVTAVQGFVADRQMFEFTATIPGIAQFPGAPLNGHFNGDVITFLSGPARNKSGRIVFYYNSDPQGTLPAPPLRFRVLFPPLAESSGSQPTWPLPGDRFLINGRAFSGTGFGFDGNQITLEALQPNRAGQANALMLANYLRGGANEPYDAADYQNMALAAMLNPLTGEVIPSFHRPALINFSGGAGPRVSLRAQFSPQSPLNWDVNTPNRYVNGPWDVDNDGDGKPDSIWIDPDLPIQTGPDGRMYKPLVAYLIVDMDGRLNLNAHGHLVNVRMPSYQDSPLTKVPFVHTDSVNFPNRQDNTSPTPAPVGRGVGTQEISLMVFFQKSFEAQGAPLPRAQVLAFRVVDTMLYGNQNPSIIDDRLKGRYGDDLPLAAQSMAPRPNYNAPGVRDPDVNDLADGNGLDAWALIRFHDLPENNFSFPSSIGEGIVTYFRPKFVNSGYGTTPDLLGEYAFGLNKFGQLTFDEYPVLNLNTGNPNLEVPMDRRPNSGYEIDLSWSGSFGHDQLAADNPFTPAEVERIMRRYDIDAGELPGRVVWLLQQLAPSLDRDEVRWLAATMNDPSFRWVFTSASHDLPIPSTLLTDRLRNVAGPNTPRSASVVEALRLATSAVPNTIDLTDHRELVKYLPPELLRGERMDLNRPFGDGRRAGNLSAIDQPREVSADVVWNPTEIATAAVASRSPGAARFAGVEFAHNNGVDVDNSGNINDIDRALARQLYARHLYVMMMMYRDGVNSPEISQMIAQWAVNVVDFRDSDSVMTGFEYDVNPFNGWQVDGILATTNEPERGVVWGCERPELVLTENFAFHDRHTEDRTDEEPNQDEEPADTQDQDDPDPDYDQRFMPESGFFVEMYNPWRDNSPKPAELYGPDTDGGIGVDLQRRSPNGVPVWRVVVARQDVAGYLDGQDLLPAMVERSIYFTPVDQTNAPPDGKPYFPSGTVTDPQTLAGRVAKVRPGHFVVFGSSGKGAKFGAGSYVTPIGRPDTWNPGEFDAEMRRIELTPDNRPVTLSAVRVWNPAPEPPQQPVSALASSIVIDAPRSLSVSDPVNGYDLNGLQYSEDPTVLGGEGAFVKPNSTMPVVIDTPLDLTRDDGVDLNINGTVPHFRAIYLQRLADPELPYDSNANPYLTIDGMSVDLTVFNGLERSGNEPGVEDAKLKFCSVERGTKARENAEGRDPATYTHMRNLWRREAPNLPADINRYEAAMSINGLPLNIPDPDYRFPYKLRCSLGYVNASYWDPFRRWDPSAEPPEANDGVSDPLGNNAPKSFVVGNEAPGNAPFLPTYSALTWNNRPFVSQYELMQVPKSSPARLTLDYRILDRRDRPYDTDISQGTPNPANPNPNVPGDTGEFGHLLNFFETSSGGNLGSTGSQFYRIFDLTHVPSRFVGTDTVFDPQRFFNAASSRTPQLVAGNGMPDTAPADAFLHAPFNHVSNFRDPGRININTIYDWRIWEAVLNGHPSATYQLMALSRQGYEASAAYGLDARYPTRFANPFRPYGMGELAPPGLRSNDLGLNEIDCTLLRQGVTASAGNSSLSGAPLMGFDGSLPYGSHQQGHYFDGTRNSVFRYDPYTRMGNLLTTRSNVYAIWITVGYFEVDPTTGLMIQEVGIETGEVTRHRGFYMIDRTIPVAFEPGKNHNVDDAVIIRRFIE